MYLGCVVIEIAATIRVKSPKASYTMYGFQITSLLLNVFFLFKVNVAQLAEIVNILQ